MFGMGCVTYSQEFYRRLEIIPDHLVEPNKKIPADGSHEVC